MDEEGGGVLEWSIDNFCCWNWGIHDTAITSPKSSLFPELTIDLYPRGLSGNGVFLVVCLGQGFKWVASDDLSYLRSDGTLLCMQRVDSSSLELLPPGPKYDEVIAQIRTNDSVYKDRLTLRLRDKRGDSVEYMRTTIDAFDECIKISPKLLEDFGCFSVVTSIFPYPLDEGDMGRLVLLCTVDQRDELVLVLRMDSFSENVLVLTRVTVLKNDENVVVDENERLFLGEDSWTFSKSLTREKIESCPLILHLKIVPNNKPKHSLGSIYVSPLYIQGVTSSASNRLLGSSERFSKSPIADISIQSDESVSVLAEELKSLYQDRDFSDFQLQCEEVSFPVHKAILSARSPVFKRLLSSDMKESLSGVVHIVDLDAPTLSHFLTFLYTGAVEGLQPESAIKLYYAADKYQVPSLRRRCANFLSANVSVSNVCDILSLGDKHQDKQLTSVAHDFILGNYHKVLRSEDWKSFMRSEPLLAAQTVTDFADFFTMRKAI